MRKRRAIIPAQLCVAACTLDTVPQASTHMAAQRCGGTTFHIMASGAKTMYDM